MYVCIEREREREKEGTVCDPKALLRVCVSSAFVSLVFALFHSFQRLRFLTSSLRHRRRTLPASASLWIIIKFPR